MRKSIALVMAGILAAGTFSACSTSGTGAASVAASAGSKGAATKPTSDVVLSIGTNQTGMKAEDLQLLCDRFTEKTGIGTDIQVNPDDKWRDLLKSKLQAGEGTDIFLIDADPMSINDRIRPEENCIDFTNAEWVSRIDKEMLPSMSYNDHVYGITFGKPKMWLFHYNKEIFEKAGIAEVPTTFEELKQACAKIQTLDEGVTPIFEATKNGWHQTLPLFETGGFMLKEDPALYDKLNKNEMKVSESPHMRTIIEQVQELADLGYYGPDFLAEDVDNAFDKMAKGEAAMYLGYVSWGLELYDRYPETEGKIGLFMMPFADSNVIGSNPANPAFFGNKTTGKVDEITQWFEFMADPETLDYHLNEISTGYAFCWEGTSTREERMPPEWAEYLDAHEKDTVMQYAVKYVDSQWMDVGRDLEAMYSGAMSVDEVLASMDNRRNEQAKLQRDEYWS